MWGISRGFILIQDGGDRSCKDFWVHCGTLELMDTGVHIIYQTSLGYPNTEKRGFFEEIRGVRIADETLSRVFDVSSQSKQKLRSKWRSKIIKIYANKCISQSKP